MPAEKDFRALIFLEDPLRPVEVEGVLRAAGSAGLVCRDYKAKQALDPVAYLRRSGDSLPFSLVGPDGRLNLSCEQGDDFLMISAELRAGREGLLVDLVESFLPVLPEVALATLDVDVDPDAEEAPLDTVVLTDLIPDLARITYIGNALIQSAGPESFAAALLKLPGASVDLLAGGLVKIALVEHLGDEVQPALRAAAKRLVAAAG